MDLTIIIININFLLVINSARFTWCKMEN